MNDMQTCFMIDLDGTIYHRSNLLPYAANFITYLKEQGHPFVFFTNSPERTHQQLADKLNSMGLSVTENQFLSTSDLAINYLKNHTTKPIVQTKLYVIGNSSFKNTLQDEGYILLTDTSDTADYVVVGFDSNLTFDTLTIAFQQLTLGANLISTNQDTSIPTETGFIPHTGPIVAFLEFAAQTKSINLGKPGKIALDCVLEHFQCTKSDLCLVGDNLSTDILLGERFDIRSFLLYTGLTTNEMVQNHPLADCVTDFDHLGSLINYLKSGEYHAKSTAYTATY